MARAIDLPLTPGLEVLHSNGSILSEAVTCFLNCSGAILTCGSLQLACSSVLFVACHDRPMKGKPLNLDGVQLQLPQAELGYLQAAAQRSSDFVVELDGESAFCHLASQQ